MIRKMIPEDKEQYIAMSKEFYRSDAVLHDIPEDNFRSTFDVIISDSPYADGYVFDYESRIAGYALLSFTYSNEAGGEVLIIEEVYIMPLFQGKGLGKEFLAFVEKNYKNVVSLIRLEVEKSNKKALQLYKKVGFTNVDYIQLHKRPSKSPGIKH
jgi:diamine N-acetyltransferase